MPIIHGIPEEEIDVCVIGGGFAGLAVAFCLAEAGRSTVILEDGGATSLGGDQDSDDIELDPASPHDPIAAVRSRALGGTSDKWGRRAVPLDPEDFDAGPERDAWPIQYAQFQRWIGKAAAFLGCSGRFTVDPPPGWEATRGFGVDRVERLTPHGSLGRIHAAALNGEGGPRVVLGARVTGLSWAEGTPARCVGVLGRRSGEAFELRARHIVIAAGGLETTRLLLAEQARNPSAIAGATLGKPYVGHVTGSIATIRFRDPRDAAEFTYRDTGEPGLARRRFHLMDFNALNIAFWPTNLPGHDPRHSSAELSAKHVADLLRARVTARDGDRPAGGLRPHVDNIMRDPLSIARSAGSVISRRLTKMPRGPERLIPSQSGLYRLAFHSEHKHEPESSVSLVGGDEGSDRRRLRIDFRIGEPTLQAIVDAHQHLRDLLARHGGACVEFCDPEDALLEAVRKEARDGYHQIGLTRMSADARSGVVDPDACVHGTTNLWVASSSIFPSAGQANPTLSIVAFAFRLAHHLIDLDRSPTAGTSNARTVKQA